jgi:hypothetical protein
MVSAINNVLTARRGGDRKKSQIFPLPLSPSLPLPLFLSPPLPLFLSSSLPLPIPLWAGLFHSV